MRARTDIREAKCVALLRGVDTETTWSWWVGKCFRDRSGDGAGTTAGKQTGKWLKM